MKQGTDEWRNARLGKVTASRIADIMGKTKTGHAASRKNYMAQLICERLTGKAEEGFKSAPMQRGNDLEPVARAVYIIETGRDVEETGMIEHPTIAMSGASPDGLVGPDGLIEIKCPNTATHLEFAVTNQPKPEYMLQMLWQMACTGRQWCDFVSYDPRLPEHLQIVIIRVSAKDLDIAGVEQSVTNFNIAVDKAMAELNVGYEVAA